MKRSETGKCLHNKVILLYRLVLDLTTRKIVYKCVPDPFIFSPFQVMETWSYPSSFILPSQAVVSWSCPSSFLSTISSHGIVIPSLLFPFTLQQSIRLNPSSSTVRQLSYAERSSSGPPLQEPVTRWLGENQATVRGWQVLFLNTMCSVQQRMNNQSNFFNGWSNFLHNGCKGVNGLWGERWAIF